MSFLRLSSCDLLWNEVPEFPFVVGFSSVKSSKILCVSLEVEPEQAPSLHCGLLAAPPKSLHLLPSLISNWWKGFHAQEPHRVLLGFSGP